MSSSSLREQATSAHIYNVILNRIKVPDESVSWDHIYEMKADQDLRRKYYTLVKWINDMISSKKAVKEIIDEYNYLLSEYEYQFNIHKVKYIYSSIEIVLNTALDVFGSILSHFTFNPSMVGKLSAPIFSVRRAGYELLDAETKIKGRELAFISDVNSIFSS
ncbi:MAG: hypothetical protein EOP51_09230 [Sphingobacteriales bacterium]|nr:MAG: hypothetical protein EOP51_09230 [Sphingobacteriales bacterium]